MKNTWLTIILFSAIFCTAMFGVYYITHGSQGIYDLVLASFPVSGGWATNVSCFNGTNYECAVGDFTPSADGMAYGIENQYTYRIGSPGDSFVAELYSGNCCSTSTLPIASSTNVGLTFTQDTTNVMNTFVFNKSTFMSSSSSYWIRYYRTGAQDASNYARFVSSNASVYPGSGWTRDSGGTWTALSSNRDFAFKIFGYESTTETIVYATTTITSDASSTEAIVDFTITFIYTIAFSFFLGMMILTIVYYRSLRKK